MGDLVLYAIAEFEHSVSFFRSVQTKSVKLGIMVTSLGLCFFIQSHHYNQF